MGWALLEACRPLNSLLAALATLLGAVLGSGPAALGAPLIWVGAWATLCSLAAGNLWNDVADLAEDAVNRPERPLVSGRLSVRVARIAANGLSLIALALALSVGTPVFLYVLLCLGSLAWYSRSGKQAGLGGNLVVAGLGSAAVALGPLLGEAAGLSVHGARMLVPAFLAGLLHLMREIVKDAQDRPGDHAAGRRTWALTAGTPRLRRLLAQLSLLTLLPPLLALLLLRDPPLLRAAHLAALFLAPLLVRRVLGAPLDSLPRLAGLSRDLKRLLAGGLALYALLGLLL
jgi:geranylgeranylglycerol-phosphate geranylgeranyltransferase